MRVIGIYKLKFNGTDKVYIGLSNNIHDRYKGHLRSFKLGTASKKLMDAYNAFGPPELEIVEECTQTELGGREKYYITYFNSVNNGFNSFYTQQGVGISDSPINGNYDKSEYEVMFLAIYESRYKHGYSVTLKTIADTLEVPEYILSQIASCRRHLWLRNTYPEEYRWLEESVQEYTCGKHSTNEALGKILPSVKDQNGIEYTIGGNLAQFCRDNNLDEGAMYRLLKGQVLTHKGFRLLSTPLPKRWTLTNGDRKEIFVEKNVQAKCIAMNLDPSSISKVIKGTKSSYLGWTLLKDEV